MFATLLFAVAVGIVSPAMDHTPGLQAGAAKTRPAATAAELAPFLGDWTLTLQGPNGPGVFTLSLRSEGDKPQGDISSDQMPKQSIAEFSMAEKTLLMPYSFTWEGNPVGAVVKLTPSPDGAIKAQIDFADGAYVMDGTATRKDKAK